MTHIRSFGSPDELKAALVHEKYIASEEIATILYLCQELGKPLLTEGPAGVGKTELAKALAEFMFGSDDAMVVLDMSEYQQDHTVNRLIGAPPGYVGFEGGGQLTEQVRKRPHTVVLFDEVEKAHSRVLDILLQIMEEGRLTDAQGRLTVFSETVIILTSNLGSEYLDKPVMTDEMRALVMAEVRSGLRPEFLNRLDEISRSGPPSPARSTRPSGR